MDTSSYNIRKDSRQQHPTSHDKRRYIRKQFASAVSTWNMSVQLVDRQTEQNCYAKQARQKFTSQNDWHRTISFSVPNNNIEDKPTRDK